MASGAEGGVGDAQQRGQMMRQLARRAPLLVVLLLALADAASAQSATLNPSVGRPPFAAPDRCMACNLAVTRSILVRSNCMGRNCISRLALARIMRER